MAKSLSSILNQIERLQKEAASIQSEVVDRIKKEIAKYSLTPEQLFGQSTVRSAAIGKPKKAASQARAPKFADGAGNTWGGMGKRPEWLRQALEAGKVLEEFLLEVQTRRPHLRPRLPSGPRRPRQSPLRRRRRLRRSALSRRRRLAASREPSRRLPWAEPRQLPLAGTPAWQRKLSFAKRPVFTGWSMTSPIQIPKTVSGRVPSPDAHDSNRPESGIQPRRAKLRR